MNVSSLLDAILKVKFLENHRRQAGLALLGAAALMAGVPKVVGTEVPFVSDHEAILTAVGGYLTLVGWLLRNDPTKKALAKP